MKKALVCLAVAITLCMPFLARAEDSTLRIQMLEVQIQRLLDLVRGMRTNVPTVVRIGTPGGQGSEVYSGEAGVWVSGTGFVDATYLVRFEGRSTSAVAVAGKMASTTENIVFKAPALEPGEYLVTVVPTASAGKTFASQPVPVTVLARPSFFVSPHLTVIVDRSGGSTPTLRVGISGSSQNSSVSFWKVGIMCSVGTVVSRSSLGDELCGASLRIDTADVRDALVGDHAVFSAAARRDTRSDGSVTVLLRAYDDAGHIIGTDRQQVRI